MMGLEIEPTNHRLAITDVTEDQHGTFHLIIPSAYPETP